MGFRIKWKLIKLKGQIENEFLFTIFFSPHSWDKGFGWVYNEKSSLPSLSISLLTHETNEIDIRLKENTPSRFIWVQITTCS